MGERAQEASRKNGIHIHDQMVIVIPESCYCPGKLQDLDPDHIKHWGFLDFTATRAGNINRNYKSSVYWIKDKQTGEVGLP